MLGLTARMEESVWTWLKAISVSVSLDGVVKHARQVRKTWVKASRVQCCLVRHETKHGGRMGWEFRYKIFLQSLWEICLLDSKEMLELKNESRFCTRQL